MITCPNELLFTIFGYLAPETIAEVALVNKHFYVIARDNVLWKAKFNLHFPHRLQAWINKKTVNWYIAFYEVYCDEYKCHHYSYHPHRSYRLIGPLFSLVKEHHFHGLRNKRIGMEDLLFQDRERKSLIDWARLANHQPMLNYFYAYFKIHYANPQRNFFGLGLLYWAIACLQPVNIVLEMLSNKKALRYHFLVPQNSVHLAAQVGHVDLLEALYSQNALILQQLDPFSRTPLICAASAGNVPSVEYILNRIPRSPKDHVDEVDHMKKTALYYAARGGHAKVVALLLQFGIDPHRTLNALLQPIHLAAQKGHLNVVTVLVKSHADLREQRCAEGKTPLMYAVIYGHVDIVAYLITQGADTDATSDCSIFPYRAVTALYYAIERGYTDIVKMLLLASRTAVGLAGPTHLSALYVAIKNNHLPVLQLLLEYDCTYLETNLGFGDTPLILAAASGHSEIVEYLIQQGANTHAVSHNPLHGRSEKTALDCAVFFQHAAVITLLLDQPAKLDSARYDLLQYFLIIQAQDHAQKDSDNRNKRGHFSFFLSRFLTPRQKKINATRALVKVVFADQPLSVLNPYKNTFRKGTLKTVYQNLVKSHIIPDTQCSSYFEVPILN